MYWDIYEHRLLFELSQIAGSLGDLHTSAAIHIELHNSVQRLALDTANISRVDIR